MKKATLKRIPGRLPPPPKSEIDGKITDLSAKTIAELIEIRDRQLKLLKNKVFINKLADKGAKIQALHDKIVTEIKLKEEEENTCNLMKNLNLDNDSVQNVEWEGKLGNRVNTYLDSDDDSDPEDILHMLSQSTAQEKKVKVLQQDKPLVTPEDLAKIGDIPHVKYLVEKAEQCLKPRSTGNYKPFKTTISDVHRPDKEILAKETQELGGYGCNSPPIVHGPAKILSLEESLKLQKEFNVHLKKIEMEHAVQKLVSHSDIKISTVSDTSKFGKYRQTIDSDDSEVSSDSEGSDKEVHDEEPERGGVVFTVLK